MTRKNSTTYSKLKELLLKGAKALGHLVIARMVYPLFALGVVLGMAVLLQSGRVAGTELHCAIQHWHALTLARAEVDPICLK